jgi:hypothetical protein
MATVAVCTPAATGALFTLKVIVCDGFRLPESGVTLSQPGGLALIVDDHPNEPLLRLSVTFCEGGTAPVFDSKSIVEGVLVKVGAAPTV